MLGFSDKKVVIVGGGIAGLSCGVRLREKGVPFLLLEASDGIGGRVRTDRVDGFLLDRGFQVYLDRYARAGEILDLEKLDLRSFEPGAMVFSGGKLRKVMDVFRRPGSFLSSLMAPVGSWRDKWLVGQLRKRVLRLTVDEIFARKELSTEAYLSRFGFSEKMIDVFFRSFYGGIFLERELRTSSRMFEFTFKMFSEGMACLPAGGMEEIPKQLFDKVGPENVRLGAEVERVDRGRVVLKGGEVIEGRAVVVATEGDVAKRLVGGEILGNVQWSGVTTFYFAAQKSPMRDKVIALSGDGGGVVNSVCVPSDLSEHYAPKGKSLVSVTLLGVHEDDDLEKRVLGELGTWFGPQVMEWDLLSCGKIEKALPKKEPLGEGGVLEVNGVLIGGDHTMSSSIEGAVRAGELLAERVIG